MKKLILIFLSLTCIWGVAHACDSLEVRQDGKQVLCYRDAKALTLAEVKQRYEKYKPEMVVLNVQDKVSEKNVQKVVSVIQKAGIKEVRIAKPEKK